MITQEHYFKRNQYPKPSPKTSTEHPSGKAIAYLAVTYVAAI